MTDEMADTVQPDQVTPVPEKEPASAPIFNLPSAIVWFVIALLLIHALRTYVISSAWDEWILVYGGFIPGRFSDFLHHGDYGWLLSLETYSLLHGNGQHVFFNCVWMVVFGAPVATRLGLWRSLLFFILASALSALGFMAVHPGSMILLIGASGIVSGLTGAACRFAMGNGISVGGRSTAAWQRQLSIREALTNRSVLFFILFWFAANVLLGIGMGFFDTGSADVAWEAHVAGFLFGFFVFPLFDPVPAGLEEPKPKEEA